MAHANPHPRAEGWAQTLGRGLVSAIQTVRELIAFALIALGVLLTKWRSGSTVVHPLIRRQIARAGIELLPITLLLAVALGFVVIGQTVALLSRVGAQDLAGTIMVTAVVRELGPLAAALLVLLRVGTATVIELGTARALGEVEVLESLGMDPVHYLVVPRVAGMMLGVLSLSVYLIVTALGAGYLFLFLQDVPITPQEYLRQLAGALGWIDFILLALKAVSFGALISVVACFHGLARPLTLEELSPAAVRATVQGLMGCVAIDALFIVVFLLS